MINGLLAINMAVKFNQRAGLILAPLIVLSTGIYSTSIALTNESAYATSEQNSTSTSIQEQANDAPTNTTLPQDGNSTSNNASSTSRSFRITFESMRINTDHDPLTAGEWILDAYVNGELVPLWVGSREVDIGNTIEFDEGNSITVTVPAGNNSNNSNIRIVTAGFENDFDYEDLPNLALVLGMDVPFPIYLYMAQDAVEEFTVGNLNDPIGFIANQFTAAENFGAGSYELCSLPNFQASENTSELNDTICDFVLNYRIEEVNAQQ
jgi:hypothetical protein